MFCSDCLQHRGTNAYLKKQLDNCSSTLQTTQQQHATHMLSIQSKLSEKDTATRQQDVNNQNLLAELHSTEQQLFTLSEQLKASQLVIGEQKNKIGSLEQERNNLIRNWESVRVKSNILK